MSNKKTNLQVTVGDESSGSCCSQLAEMPRGRICKAPSAGKLVVAEMPENHATVQVDNRDPCRSRMVLTVEDMAITMEQSTCSRTTGARNTSVTTLCVQTNKGCCRHHCPPKNILETQIVVRK